MENERPLLIFKLKILNDILKTQFEQGLISILLSKRFETFQNFNSQSDSYFKELKTHLLWIFAHLTKCA
jgi:hypothetical protein